MGGSLFIIQSFLADLEDVMKQDDILPFDVKELIKMLYQQLMPYRPLVRDVELLHFLKNEGLEEVTAQIRYAACEAEYLINSFLVGDTSCWYLTIRLNHVIEKIKSIGTEHPKMTKDSDVLVVKATQVSTTQPSIHAGHCLEVNDITPIFEEQETHILEQLVGGMKPRQSIFILGMAGIGKTTLAKKLYHDPIVRWHFDRRVWCNVSHMPDWRNVLTSILTSLNSEYDKAPSFSTSIDEERLTLKIYQSFKDRRFLIVIDDIWQLGHLEYLQRYFPDDQNGSRILLTSRNANVAQYGSFIHQLPLWLDDQCLQLLKKKAFQNCDSNRSQLEEIGKKIAAKCYGLPLVAVVIAGILSTMDKEESPLKILHDSLDYYEHFDQSTSIMQVLELSYKNLPPYLKACFLYLGVFNEDEKEIPIKKLKQLWIAEGLIHKEGDEKAENIAEQILKELIDKNLIIVTKKRSDGGAKVCVIHDLLRDLCRKIAAEENFLTWIHSDHSMYNQRYIRLCVNNETFGTSVLSPFGLRFRSLFVSVLPVRLSLYNMKLLRALQCWSARHGSSALVGVEFLFHLRYLATNCVPALIHRNSNLEYLILDQRIRLTPEILKMPKLRYISSPEIVFGRDCGPETNKLEFLSTVIIRSKKDQELLGYSPNLCKLKCRCDWELEARVVSSLDFQFFAQCESLTLTKSFTRGMVELKLPSNIKKLNLIGFNLPWENMSMIGALPNLEILKLGNKAFEGEIWNTGDDKYPCLRFLKMEGLGFYRWLVDSSEQFPRLQHMVLNNCPNLMDIPSEIGDITTLCVIEFQGRLHFQSSLLKSALKIQEQQQDMGNVELRVIIAD